MTYALPPEGARFINGLKILRFIEIEDLRVAGVEARFARGFLADPCLWLMKASDADQARVWSIIESQQPKPVAQPGAGLLP